MRSTFLLFLVLASLFISAPAIAQPLKPEEASPELLAYIDLPFHVKKVMYKARGVAALVPSCKLDTLKRVKLRLFGPVEFEMPHRPSKGIWIEVYSAEGCDQSGLFNILSMVDSKRLVQVITLLPGTSRADALLQKDAIPYAHYAAIKKIPADCKTINIIDTKFVNFEGNPSPDVVPGRDPRPWKEEWKVSACGTITDTTLYFIPDSKGTAITAELVK